MLGHLTAYLEFERTYRKRFELDFGKIIENIVFSRFPTLSLFALDKQNFQKIREE